MLHRSDIAFPASRCVELPIVASSCLALRASARASLSHRVRLLFVCSQRAGISLDNRQAIRQLVVARSRVSTQQGDASKPRKPAQPQGADEIDISTLITPSTIAPFVFPSKEIESDRADAEPLTVEPLEPFNEIKCFALRVPRRYQQMQYEQLPMTVPGTFPALLTSRTLRSGAAHEDGLPPIVGAADAFPITPLPPPLLRPPAADAVDAEDAVAAASFPALTLPPKPLLAPPQHNETSPELQLRATVRLYMSLRLDASLRLDTVALHLLGWMGECAVPF
eukprot:134504-Pleurochrysis_carterae.AAC.5